MRKRYATPHCSRVVKTRMTEEEYADFIERLAAYEMSQSEFIRQAITGTTVRPIINVSPVNDELLAALKFEVLQKVGEAVGDIQTYQL